MSELAALYKSMIEFQTACPAIDKDAEVSVKTQGGASYKFQYATFGNIKRSIQESLTKAKLAYTFITTDSKFICRVIHESGQFQDTSLDLPKMSGKMQEYGSALTYLKRYSLVLALGLDTDADDDANGADGNDATFKPKEHSKDVDKYIKTADIKEYRIKVGKFKGKALREVDALDLQSYLTWLHGQAKEKGQALTGDWAEFAKIAEAFIAPE